MPGVRRRARQKTRGGRALAQRVAWPSTKARRRKIGGEIMAPKMPKPVRHLHRRAAAFRRGEKSARHGIACRPDENILASCCIREISSLSVAKAPASAINGVACVV